MQNKEMTDQSEAINQIKIWQQSGLNVVMTNGCFDILHVGHLRYLEASAKLGDKLVVAINGDESVRRLKGESRPINKLSDRKEMLLALSCVDLVISFDTDTPEELICTVLPDILTKGGDYTIDQIAGGKCVLLHGGEVKIIEFEPGYSSTKIIESL